jgi:hypothetical protein
MISMYFHEHSKFVLSMKIRAQTYRGASVGFEPETKNARCCNIFPTVLVKFIGEDAKEVI